MPESLLDRRLKLGTFLGIGLYVHWSFGLLVAYAAISNRADGIGAMAFAVAMLLGAFSCVTLHEYGHAMAARRFGIGTADITLLPIGGVARLKRMPRIPWQELVVAVAGPAVNVVIASLLLIGFLTISDGSALSAIVASFGSMFSAEPLDEEMIATIMELSNPSWTTFAVVMLMVNLMLVLFNMVPAFPMDGGRVFRSLLAMTMDYRRATWIASRVGLLCAVIMAVLALSSDPPNPIPVLIAAFIGYAGIAEARQVDVMESIRGLTVRQVMIHSQESIAMDMPLSQIAQRWETIDAPALPVVSLPGTVVGMLGLREVIDAVVTGKDPMTTAGQLIDHEKMVGWMQVDELLDAALMRTGRQARLIPVVDATNRLIGVVDVESMIARGKLSRHMPSTIEPALDQFFDQIT
ncbi:MAG: site-2 protease family protein [Rubripirellula sp.]